MLKLLKRLTPSGRLLALVILGFTLTQVWLDLRLIEYMKEITLLVQTAGSPQRDIWLAGGLMLLCALGSITAAIIICLFASRISSSFAKELRSGLFNKVGAFSMEEINRFSTASLITRSTNDITQVQMFLVMGFQLVTRSPIMAAWAITKIAGKGIEWSMVTAGAVLILIIMVLVILVFVVPKFKMMQILTDNLTLIAREHLSGLRVIRAYNAEDYQDAKFEKANTELTNVHLFTSRAMSVMMPMITFIMSGLSLAIYWVGAYLINAADIPERLDIFSDMVVFSSYATRIIMSFLLLVMVFFLLPRASVSAKRINEVLETKPCIIGGNITESDPDKKGEIVFNNVSFKYPDAADYVLQDISFTAKRGETIALIGSTGSGKSTLINLIPRFFDSTQGDITISGINIKHFTLEALNSKIGYVPQKAVMFSGTVSSNIAYGDNGRNAYTEGDIKNAARISEALEFTENMDGGFNAEIAQGGTNISGGQKQRLAIARAICRKPEIYIFDDSFSALDYKTDRVLRSALKKETSDVTCLIVAQRIGTVMDADQIIVLDEGRIAGAGTHRELLQTCGIYREIAASQLSEEELSR
ncbi:MAG: ABC transporter ATP-binding protein/permease [Oscillospiraceae bacterium]|jgi:ATP-binding cassette subfamily B protein|nr:ABC transporter ATP-binding protein/permease [Oscillospiraceae bacterium]